MFWQMFCNPKMGEKCLRKIKPTRYFAGRFGFSEAYAVFGLQNICGGCPSVLPSAITGPCRGPAKIFTNCMT